MVRTAIALPYSGAFGGTNGSVLGTNWNEWAGSFDYLNNAAVGQGTANVATLYSVSVNDSTISADVTSVPLGGFAGLVSRYDAATGNMYRAGLSGTFNTKTKHEQYTAQIWRKLGGRWTLLTSVAVSGPGELTFVTTDSSEELFLNNVLVAHAGDTKLKTGGVGIYATKGAAVSSFNAAPPVMNAAALPFTDNFSTDAAISANWYTNVGGFGLASGALQGLGTNNVLTLNGVSQQNVSVMAQIQSVPLGTLAGVLARYNAATGNTYMADIVATYDAHTKSTVYTAQIQRRVKGVWKVLYSVGIAQLGSLGFSVSGNQLTLYVGGVQMKTVTDNTITAAGSVGLTGGQGTQVSDFTAG